MTKRRPFDAEAWARVRARFGAEAPDPARDAEILERRALALARPAEAAAREEALSVLRFATAGEAWAIDVAALRAVVKLGAVTPVPGLPERWRGVAAFRGHVLPLVDLARHLGLARAAPEPADARVLVLGEAELGVVVDEAHDIVAVPLAHLRPPPPGPTGPLLRGVTDDGLAVLDGARLCADPRLSFGAREAPPAELP